jgi:hypothetical protein
MHERKARDEFANLSMRTSLMGSGTLAPLSIYLRDIDPGEGSFPFGGSYIVTESSRSYRSPTKFDHSPETVDKKTVLEA